MFLYYFYKFVSLISLVVISLVLQVWLLDAYICFIVHIYWPLMYNWCPILSIMPWVLGLVFSYYWSNLGGSIYTCTWWSIVGHCALILVLLLWLLVLHVWIIDVPCLLIVKKVTTMVDTCNYGVKAIKVEYFMYLKKKTNTKWKKKRFYSWALHCFFRFLVFSNVSWITNMKPYDRQKITHYICCVHWFYSILFI
jgi:hypothetical protein